MFRKLVKVIIPRMLFRAIEPYGHLVEAILANIRYGFPAKSLRVIAITGTNGKTTTAAFITGILESAGYKVGVSTTAFFKVGKDYRDNELNMTVTKSFVLQRLLRQMADAKVDFAIVELTSSALAQNRSWGVKSDVAVLTNISQDHLDYHGTMERYVAAKQRMFQYNPKLQVLNEDDKYYKQFAKLDAKSKLSYGISAGDVIAGDVKLAADGSVFEIIHGDYSTRTELKLPGEYNVYNALAAAAVGLGLGIPAEQIQTGLESVQSVPGRMERIDEGQKFGVIVDYAHTEDALSKLYTALRPGIKGRLIAVFGATGDRDKSKRPKMGEVAGKQADVVILTTDEPYHEDPTQVISEILPGAQKGKTLHRDLFLEPDRRAAIAKAFAMAEDNDVIAITGMGHQKYMVIGDKKVPWDDRKVAREELKKLKGGK